MELDADTPAQRSLYLSWQNSTAVIYRCVPELKEDKKQLEQQIKVAAGDEEKMKELEKKLAQIEGE